MTGAFAVSELTHVALLSYPVVVAVLFARFSTRVALAWTILGGVLFLPTEPVYDLPAVPAIGKDLLPALLALAFCAAAAKGRKGLRDDPSRVARTWLPMSPVARLLFVMMLASPVFTGLTNRDPIAVGSRAGLGFMDIGNMLYAQMEILLVIVLGRRFLSDDDGKRVLLTVIATGGLIYLLPVLFEARMSPQLNVHFYGYTNIDWFKMSRGEGWRPIVFMERGLQCAIFMSAALVAVAAVARHFARGKKQQWQAGSVGMIIGLVAMRSLGAQVLGFTLGALVMFAGRRLQITVAMVISVLLLVYPASQATGVFPDRTLVSLFQAVNEVRGGSLGFRFLHEDAMIERLDQRPLFGWGGWGRERVYDERGRDVTIVDSHFILTFAKTGWFGFLAQYGLLTVFTIVIWLQRRRHPPNYIVTGLALVQCVLIIDLLLNDTIMPIHWLIAGVLIGHVERLREGRPERRVPMRDTLFPAPALPTPAAPARAADPAPEGVATARTSARLARQW